MRGLKRKEYREYLPTWLADADARVRFAAVHWIADDRLTDYRDDLGKVLTIEPVPRNLYEAYLAALDALNGTPRNDHWAEHGERHVASMLDNDKSPAHLRRLALRMLRPDYPHLSRERWNELLATNDAELKLEAVRSLRGSRLGDRAARLVKIAEDAAAPAEIRAEAIVGLDASDEKQRPRSCRSPYLRTRFAMTLAAAWPVLRCPTSSAASSNRQRQAATRML